MKKTIALMLVCIIIVGMFCGCNTQDICLVRPHYEYKKSLGDFEIDNDFVDCIVWGNSDYEDYTNKHIIAVNKEEE